jgi:hypothetical protein
MVVSSMSTCSYFCSFVKNLFIGDDKQIFQVKKKKTNVLKNSFCNHKSLHRFSVSEAKRTTFQFN